MSDYVPSLYEFALLALAAFYLYYLIGEAAIFDRPRDWLSEKVGTRFDDLVSCPWCSSFYIVGLGWTVGWLLFPTETVVLAVPFASMTVVGFLGTILHALADAD
jgi:hypothetical protein